MEQKTKLVAVDTDVFIRDLRYLRDRESKTNTRFLETLHDKKNGVTTIVNLLEVCGILSFNLSAGQLKELFFYFPERYQVEVLPIHSLEESFPELTIGNLFEAIEKRSSFGDALVANMIKQYLPGADLFVSWNARHFRNMHIPAVTPAEFLKLRY